MNSRPSACEADVITTTPSNRCLLLVSRSIEPCRDSVNIRVVILSVGKKREESINHSPVSCHFISCDTDKLQTQHNGIEAGRCREKYVWCSERRSIRFHLEQLQGSTAKCDSQPSAQSWQFQERSRLDSKSHARTTKSEASWQAMIPHEASISAV